MLHIRPKNIPPVKKLVEMAQPVLAKRAALYDRINRGASQTTMMYSGDDKAKVAFEQQNVGVATGYLGGIEPTITNVVDDELNKEYISKLNDILRYNDFASKHLTAVRDTMSANAHYLYINFDKLERITFSGIDSQTAAAFYDYEIEPNIVLLLRQWVETDEKGNEISVAETIMADGITQYEAGKTGEYAQRGITKSLAWGDVPVCSFEGINDIALIEPIVPLVKMYEQIIQNIASMTQYNDNAKLIMKGYKFPFEHLDNDGKITPEYEAAQRALLEATVLEVDADGDFNWLLKEINYSGMLEVLKSIHQLIMFVVASPDTTDTTFSAAESSLALRLKMFPFEQRVTDWKAVYKQQYLRLIEIITNRLNILKDPKLTLADIPLLSREEKKTRGLYDFANIEVEINVNVPVDKLKDLNIAEVMNRMNKFTDKTIIEKAGVVRDAGAEAEAKKKQDDELMTASRVEVVGNGQSEMAV